MLVAVNNNFINFRNYFHHWHVVFLEGVGINMLYIFEYLRMLKYHTELYYVRN
jgi:hypothetical protein